MNLYSKLEKHLPREKDTTLCQKCGYDVGLHQYETEHCPIGGEAIYPRKQQWSENKFENRNDLFNSCKAQYDEVLRRVVVDEEKLTKIVESQVGEARDCQNCGNEGYTVVQVGCKQYVTRDMAMDACEPSMEGMEIGDDEFEQEQCQWCYCTLNSKFNINNIVKAIANSPDMIKVEGEK